MVRPERFELPTCCSGGLAARQTNNLARLVGVALVLVNAKLQQAVPHQIKNRYKPPLGTILGTVKMPTDYDS